MTTTPAVRSRAVGAAWVIGVLIGVVVGLLLDDVILGIIAGAGFITVTVGFVRLWNGGNPQTRHP